MNLEEKPEKDLSASNQETISSDPKHVRISNWEIGKILLDEYQIKGILGKGMGIVYKVEPCQFQGPPIALKTLFSSSLGSREQKRGIMNELRVWIELPDHPYFTAFRFFRTIQDRIGIFIEYVDGGSLEDWISARKLLTLDKILDMAIQFAWTIETLHLNEVIHQDIKPKNLLITKDGQAKLTDFGLAHSRDPTGSSAQPENGFQDYEVSFRGGTRAYCSPEQFACRKLTLHTDIWSFGVSVLQMFTGGVIWENGSLISLFLEKDYVPGGYSPIVPMPDSIRVILHRCFERERNRRWRTMTEVADALIEAYRLEIGTQYPRMKIASGVNSRPLSKDPADYIANRKQWVDPVRYIDRLKGFVVTASTGESLIPHRIGLPKTRALADLQIYEDIVHHKLFSPTERKTDEEMAEIFANKALVHLYLHDYPGVIASLDSAIAILKVQSQLSENKALLLKLANAYQEKAICLNKVDRNREALETIELSIQIFENQLPPIEDDQILALHGRVLARKAAFLKDIGCFIESNLVKDSVISIFHRLLDKENREEYRTDLALAYLNKATSLKEVAQYLTAIEYYDRAITEFEQLLIKDGRKYIEPALAMTHMNKAASLKLLGRYEESLTQFDRSIDIRKRLIYEEGRHELEDELAICYLNKGTTLDSMMRFQEAFEHYNRCIDILERLIYREGRHELEPDLAMVLLNKGSVMEDIGRPEEKNGLYRRSAQMYEHLIEEKGRHQYKPHLSMVYMNQAISCFHAEEFAEALTLFDRSIAIRSRLVHEEGRGELMGDLCWAQLGRVQVLDKLGQTDQARTEAKEAYTILNGEYRRTSRADIKVVLDYAEKELQYLIS